MGAAAPFAIMGGLQAGSALYQAAQQRKLAAASQRYYNYIADQTEKHAALTLKRGDEQVTSIQDNASLTDKNYRRSVEKVHGSQRAAAGASGLSADSVTSEDIARDTTNAQNIDESAIRFDADSKSWTAATAAADQARAEREQARQLRMAGANARQAGDINATTSLINGAVGIGSNFAAWKMNYPSASSAPQTNYRTVQYGANGNYGYTPSTSKNILSLY